MEDIDFLFNEEKYSFSPVFFDTENVVSDLSLDSDHSALFSDPANEMEVEIPPPAVVDNDVFSDSDSVASEAFDILPIHNNKHDSFNEMETCSEPFNFESIDVEKEIGPFTESEKSNIFLWILFM